MKKKIISFIGNIDLLVSVVALATLILLTFAGVIWRRLLHSPFTWMEEVQLACMVWIVFGGASVAFRTGSHVAIELFTDMLPEKYQKAITTVISIIVVLVMGYLFYNSLSYLKIFFKNQRKTSILNIPYWLIYGIAPVTIITMVLSYFYSLRYHVLSEVKEAMNE